MCIPQGSLIKFCHLLSTIKIIVVKYKASTLRNTGVCESSPPACSRWWGVEFDRLQKGWERSMSIGKYEFFECFGSMEHRDFLVHFHLALGLFALQLSTLQVRVPQRLHQQYTLWRVCQITNHLLTSSDNLGFHNLTGRYQDPYFVLTI